MVPPPQPSGDDVLEALERTGGAERDVRVALLHLAAALEDGEGPPHTEQRAAIAAREAKRTIGDDELDAAATVGAREALARTRRQIDSGPLGAPRPELEIGELHAAPEIDRRWLVVAGRPVV